MRFLLTLQDGHANNILSSQVSAVIPQGSNIAAVSEAGFLSIFLIFIT